MLPILSEAASSSSMPLGPTPLPKAKLVQRKHLCVQQEKVGRMGPSPPASYLPSVPLLRPPPPPFPPSILHSMHIKPTLPDNQPTNTPVTSTQRREHANATVVSPQCLSRQKTSISGGGGVEQQKTRSVILVVVSAASDARDRVLQRQPYQRRSSGGGNDGAGPRRTLLCSNRAGVHAAL